MWKTWSTSLIILSITISAINAHCTRNGSRFEEVNCINVTPHQLQNELNNILNNVIVPDFNVIVATRIVITDSTLETINRSLFTNIHLVNVQELFIINSQVKNIEPEAFQDMFSLQSIKINGNFLQRINGNSFPSYVTKIDLSNNNIRYITNFCQRNSGSGLQELILSNNNLVELDENAFQNCVSLNVLILDHSNIKTIKRNTFSNLGNLGHLNISYNKLNEIVFGINSNLFSLDVSYNKISTLNFDNTNSLLNLHSLLLNNNNITVIKNNYFKIFPRLQLLDLNSNPIEKIEPNTVNLISNSELRNVFINKTIRNLKPGIFGEHMCGNYLNLSDSRIETIEPDTFISCSYLTELNLHKNKITKLPNNTFNGLNKLNILILTDNKIDVIEPGAFILSTNSFNVIRELYLSNLNNFEADSYLGLSNLVKISISNSDLEAIDSASFRYMPVLREIHLSRSNINTLKPYAFSGAPNLIYLNLSHNTYEYLNSGVFLNSGSIRNLDMSYSKFKTSPNFKKVFKGLNSLVGLILLNSNLDSITTEDFYHLQNLGYLELSSNRIAVIPEFAFSNLLQMRTLDLKNNEISEISNEGFKNLTNLIELDLSNNHIKSLKVGVFRDLKQLVELRLNNNFLTEIKIGTFSALNSLRFLNVSNNRLEYFSEEVFYNLINLEYLDIRSNVIVFNDVVSAPIVHLRSLKYLGISNNYWRCSALVAQLKLLKDQNIFYKSSYAEIDYEYDKTNIDGIHCS